MVIPFRQLLAPGVEPAGGPPVGIVHIPKLLAAALPVQPAVDPQGKSRQRFRTLRQQDHRLLRSQRLQSRLHGLVAAFLQKYALARIQQGNPLQLSGQSSQAMAGPGSAGRYDGRNPPPLAAEPDHSARPFQTWA